MAPFYRETGMGTRDWPEDARPREKLLKQGAAVLSDAELVAVFLRTGMVGKSAVDLGRDLIARFGGLGGLCRADRKSACAAPGVGEAKFALLQAVMEMARRTLAEDMQAGGARRSPPARRVADALALVDVRVLDHFIVAGASSLSFMESGQL